MKGDNAAYVDAFTNIRSMVNSNCAIGMNLFDKEGTNSVLTKFAGIRVLNENVLSNSVIHSAAFGVCT